MSKAMSDETKEMRAMMRGEIFTLTDYGSGMTDYVRVFVVDKGRIRERTYTVASYIGEKRKRRGIPVGGGGYNKALHIMDWAGRKCGQPFEQGRWTEL